MNTPDIELFKLGFRAAMSREYFATMEWRWWIADVVFKVVVALVVVLGVYTAAGKPKWVGKYGFHAATASALLAIIILIIPADKWAQDYRDLAFQWGLVKQKVDGVETSATDDVKLAAIKEIKTQAGSIREPSIWRTLLVQCYGDQNERIYGLGRRSYDQVVEYLKSIGVQVPTPPPVPPPGAPGKPNEDAQASRNLQPS